MAKSLRQLTASYERMVRTQRQNADKLATGEWNDDDVFAEAFRQAAAYKGRAIEQASPSSPGRLEQIATYLVAAGEPVIDLDTTTRSFLVEDVDDGVPEATRAMIHDNAESLPQRNYTVFCERRDGKVTRLIFDLNWQAANIEDYSIQQAREYIAWVPGMIEVAHRVSDQYPTLVDSVDAKVGFLRAKFGL